MRILAAILIAFVLTLSVAEPASARQCRRGRSSVTAMWFSILHPGLGEWYLRGWGGFDRCPQKKFWLGLIPGYGWPGYLQVKSAIDAANCRTNDRI